MKSSSKLREKKKVYSLHTKERTHLLKLLDEQGFEEIFVSGPAGTGKTFLVNDILEEKRDTHFIIRHKFSFDREASTQFYLSFLKQILFCLDIEPHILQNDSKKVISYFTNLPEQDVSNLLNAIKEETTSQNHLNVIPDLILKLIDSISCNCLIFLDDMQWETPNCQLIINELLKVKPPNIKLIFCSRINFDQAHVRLLNLNENGSRSFVQEWNKKNNKKLDSKKLHNLTGGNPFYLNFLIQNNGKYNSTQTVKDVTIDLLNSLSPEHRNFIKFASCIRSNIEADDAISLPTLHISRPDLLYLEKLGLLDLSHGFVRISHDILREVYKESLTLHEKSNFHKLIGLTFCKKPLSAENIEEIAYHFSESQQWRLLYKHALKGTNYAFSRFMPELALTLMDNVLQAATHLKLLTSNRRLRISILRSKVIFLLGLTESADKDLYIIEKHLADKNIRSAKIYAEASNLLSLYHWNNGNLPEALRLTEDYLKSGNNLKNVSPLFLFRQIGILSDMGEFKRSTTYALKALDKKTSGDKISILGLNYLLQSSIASIIARNYAYMGNKNKFLYYSQIADNNIDDDFSLASVFTLTYLADGAIQLGLLDKSYIYIERALYKARKNRLTTLNSFLFSMLGYIEVMNGKKSSIDKIQQSIGAVEAEKRYGRLPLYYLYLIKAKRHISGRAYTKRIIRHAQKIALQNSENWVYSELSRYS